MSLQWEIVTLKSGGVLNDAKKRQGTEKRQGTVLCPEEKIKQRHRTVPCPYVNELGYRESGNNYSAVNQNGCLGKYQIENIALEDIGFKDGNGNWTSLANSYGVYSNNDFLNSPNVQEIAIRKIHKKTWGYIKSYGLEKYIGSTYNGVIVTESGLLAACHLVGIGTMNEVLPTGAIAWDGNHVPAHEYMSSFGGYDISEVC